MERVLAGEGWRINRSRAQRRLPERRVAGRARPRVTCRDDRVPRQVAVVAGQRELVERVVGRQVRRVELIAAEERIRPRQNLVCVVEAAVIPSQTEGRLARLVATFGSDVGRLVLRRKREIGETVAWARAVRARADLRAAE